MAILICLVGVSGSGKTAVGAQLRQKYHLTQVVTSTTRQPRTGETAGEDYHFVVQPNPHWLAPAQYRGAHYGIDPNCIDQLLLQQSDCYVVVEYQGALVLSARYPQQCCVVCLQVPQCLAAERMAQRGDCSDHIAQRMQDIDAEQQQLLAVAHVCITVDNLTSEALADVVMAHVRIFFEKRDNNE